MSKLLNPTRDKFTVIQNCIFQDQRLGFHARGVLCTLISLPDGWDYSVKGLTSLVCESKARGEGKDGIRTTIHTLEDLGYLKRVQSFDPISGKFMGYDYIIQVPPEPTIK